MEVKRAVDQCVCTASVAVSIRITRTEVDLTGSERRSGLRLPCLRLSLETTRDWVRE